MADRRKFEEILEDIRREGLEDLADELEAGYGKSALREQAAKVPELERALAEAQAKLERLEKAPLKEKAFRDYGVDWDALRPLERSAIEAYEGELTPERIAEFVETHQLPTRPATEAETGSTEAPAAAAVVEAARRAPAGRVGQGPRITPDDVRGWPSDKWLRFRQEHPEAAEQILKGQTVTGITF